MKINIFKDINFEKKMKIIEVILRKFMFKIFRKGVSLKDLIMKFKIIKTLSKYFKAEGLK